MKILLISIMALGMIASATADTNNDCGQSDSCSENTTLEERRIRAYEKYDYIFEFSKGLAVVMNKTWLGTPIYGYIDRNYRAVVEPQFRGVRAFSHCVAKVVNGQVQIYINRKGEYAEHPGRWKERTLKGYCQTSLTN